MPGGIAFLNRDHPAAHDMNRIVVTEPRSPAALANAADAVFSHRAPNHRLLDVYDAELGDRLARGAGQARPRARQGPLGVTASIEDRRDVPTVTTSGSTSTVFLCWTTSAAWG